jgi:hypothetical protein
MERISEISVPRISTALACLVLLSGCRFATAADSTLVLTMTADRASLGPGDTAHLTLTLTNRSASATTVPTPHCVHYFGVTDSADRSAGPPQTVCFAILPAPTTLGPGESLIRHDTWAADSGKEYSGHTLRVGSGTYTLRGVFAGPERPITSNAVAIAVSSR